MSAERDATRRALHGALAAAAVAAFATGRAVDAGAWHATFGVAAAAALALRGGVALGSVGPGPVSPSARASAAVGALLVASLAVTGGLVAAGEEGLGPGAAWVAPATGVAAHGLHRTVAWAGVAWLAVHVAGVARHTWAHGEGLVRSMLPGGRRPGAAGALLLGVAAAAVVAHAVPTGGRAPPAPGARWSEACGDCHLPYAPTLLPPAAWREMVAADDHFGEVLGLDADTGAALVAVAEAQAGATEHSVRVAGEAVPDGRVTGTEAWRVAHARVPEGRFTAPDGRDRRGRCDACHEGAREGVFDARRTREPQWAADAAGRS